MILRSIEPFINYDSEANSLIKYWNFLLEASELGTVLQGIVYILNPWSFYGAEHLMVIGLETKG